MSKEKAFGDEKHPEKRDGDKLGDIEHTCFGPENEEESFIEEVRVTVSNKDDPTLPCNTFRMWFLGLGFSAAIAFVNQFFYMRQTGVTVSYPVVALLSLPLGHLMARTLPTTRYSLFGYNFTLNPGPFSIKEHVLIGTMTSINSYSAYAVDIVVLQKVFYHDEKPFIAGLLLVWTTQIMGFSLAGVLRKFLVESPYMIFPENLVTAALFRSLHSGRDSSAATKHSSLSKYFLIVVFVSFAWHFLPGLIFPTIGVISWLCWIKPDNVILAQLTGSYGLGIGTIALDWTAISAYISPMVNPWFAQVNGIIGFVVFAYIIIPWAYYNDLWNSKKYPIVSPELFYENGTYYDVSEVMSNGRLDRDKYLSNGPMRMGSSSALAYGLGFAGLCATIVHVALFNGRDIVERWRTGRHKHEDIHTRLMRAYPEVPDWWYGALFIICISLSIATCAIWELMPWWGVILALCIALIFVLPIGVVQAVTNQQPGLHIITEYIFGYIRPGYPIDNVTFKTYGYIVNIQALAFVLDLKLGHYLKIPPRIMFMTQLVSTAVCSTINLATAVWLVDTRPNICTREGYPFTCRSTNTFYAASVIWGAIAPARVFGQEDGAIYSPTQWGFFIGALAPIPFWVLTKMYPNVRWLQLVHWPVLLTLIGNMPPALPYFYTNGFFWGFIFSFVLRRYRFGWWARYSYLTSAGLDTGVALATIIIFFTLQIHGKVKIPHWWGNPNMDIDWENASIEEKNAASLDHCYHGYSNYFGEQG
ncbi:hypothetical protein DFQ27_001440 [Actinomortierella ambigua]|uniref:OPT family small oligopeptide transporter n=1 Tax=Actinomortierella ambigua TaxID=1343610 RepID=A0A9P6QA67_9FUNG|nr:hypothetical protein DFQ27_001440 [Actinomortierella ambigua]